MKKVNNLLSVLFVVCFFTSCDELDTTQTEAPIFKLSTNSIEADNVSAIEITIESGNGNLFSPDQDLTLTTTDGVLFETPTNTLSTGGSKEIIIFPNNKFYKAYLRSGLNVNDNVVLFAKVANHVQDTTVTFTLASPENIFTFLNKDSLRFGKTDNLELRIILRKSKGLVSLNHKMNISIALDSTTYRFQQNDTTVVERNYTPNDLLIFEEVLFANNDTITVNIQSRFLSLPGPLLTESSGTITISDTLNNSQEEKFTFIR